MTSPARRRQKDIPAAEKTLALALHKEGLSPEEITVQLAQRTGVRRKQSTIVKVIERRAQQAARAEKMEQVKTRLKALFKAGMQAGPAADVIRREFAHHMSEMGVRSAWWKMGLRRPALYRDRWRGKLKEPPHGHPFVRALFREMNQQATSISDVSERAGIPRGTISDWSRKLPRMDLLEAALNVLDLELAIRPRAQP